MLKLSIYIKKVPNRSPGLLLGSQQFAVNSAKIEYKPMGFNMENYGKVSKVRKTNHTLVHVQIFSSFLKLNFIHFVLIVVGLYISGFCQDY